MRVENVLLGDIDPNPWNPNRMTERQFKATVASLAQYGFTTPILVRPHPTEEGRYQIIDGEHRWRAVREMARSGVPEKATADIREIVAAGVVPAHVMPMSDAMAKRATIVMNETRGAPDEVELGRLLHDLMREYSAEELMEVIPFGQDDIQNLLDAANRVDAETLEDAERAERERAEREEREKAKETLSQRFGLPPFSVLNAREGWWQDRKRAWIGLGIRSELGRGTEGPARETAVTGTGKLPMGRKANATPGGSAMPSASYSKDKARGNGRGRPIQGGS